MGSDRIRLRWVEGASQAVGSSAGGDDLAEWDDDEPTEPAGGEAAGGGVAAVTEADPDEVADDTAPDVGTDTAPDLGGESEPPQPAGVNGTGGTAVGLAPRFRVDARPHHELVDAITAVAAAAGLLSDRWNDLTDEQRRELAVTIKRRADDVRGCLGRAAR